MGAATESALRPLNAGAAAPRANNAAPATPSAGRAGFFSRSIKFLLALALIPACIGLTMGVHDHFTTLLTRVSFGVFGPGTLLTWFGGGAVVFVAFTILLWRPVVLYVLGHELVHAFATWACLGRVSNLSASAAGGQVTTSKSNTFIRLAPYCVPFYVAVAAAAYLALDAWWMPLKPYAHFFCAALGFFYAFHVGFTLWSLRRDQPDLKPDGWIFSLVLIYLANLAVFALILGFLSDGRPHGGWTALRDSFANGWIQTLHIYHHLATAAEHFAGL